MLNIGRSEAIEPTRPFRVFVALMDKWEIGYPLSQALGYDTLVITMEANSDGADTTVAENVRRLCFERSMLLTHC